MNLDKRAPWYDLYHELEGLFAYDEDVNVVFDKVKLEVKLYVTGAAKAAALSRLIADHKSFGNIEVPIDVIPSNDGESVASLVKTAFAGNPIVADIIEVPGDVAILGDATYLVVQNETIQYDGDNLASPWGIETVTVEEALKDVVADLNGLLISTDAEVG